MKALLRAALLAGLAIACGSASAAGDEWKWTVLEPSAREIGRFGGTGTVELQKNRVVAKLANDQPALDPFVFRGRVAKGGDVTGDLEWPHSDSGPVSLRGKWKKHRNPDASTYEVIWLVDSLSGIYLVMTRTSRAR